jgi:S-DNA-T family DNA segregation ATPase FtsK/SpoIIIE
MVAAMARSLVAGGTPLVVFAPRPGAVRDLAGLPGVLATVTGDDVTPADVAVLLDRPGVVLVDNGQGLVLGGNTTGLAAGFGGWQVDAKKIRRGALLSSQDTLAADLVGIRISRTSISSRVQPGTALVHLGTGLASTVQVPMLTPTTRTGSAVAPAAVLSVGSVGVSTHVVAGLEARVG